ncbi:hypothetical protein IW148_004509 [Coemansia sp. RSA 1199]|nr:hypothetical protein IW148_004509 [Coemansia sp. RSA 1199]
MSGREISNAQGKGQAVSKLQAAVNPENSTVFNEAMREFEIISKTYKRAYAEYKNAHDTHILQVRAAAERVERLLYSPTKSVATVTGEMSTQTSLSLLEGLPPIYVRDNSEPSIHPGTVQGFSDADAICDPEVRFQISHFQAQAMQHSRALQDVKIILRQAVPSVSTGNLRHLDREQDLVSFFEPEILEPVQAIIDKVCPGVLVGGRVGYSNGHADYFLVVSVFANGVSRRSAIAVNFKKPYGASKEPLMRSIITDVEPGESEFDSQMRLAGLPTQEYGRLAIGHQLREYVRVRDIATRAPADVASCLNRDYGIITDYNQTWVVNFESISASPSASTNDNSNNNLEGSDNSSEDMEFIDRTENLLIRVSERFVAGNSMPHMAFVYAFVVSKVADNIRASLNSHPRPGRALGSARWKSRRGRGRGRGQG